MDRAAASGAVCGGSIPLRRTLYVFINYYQYSDIAWSVFNDEFGLGFDLSRFGLIRYGGS